MAMDEVDVTIGARSVNSTFDPKERMDRDD
jgi:hypothetical protein